MRRKATKLLLATAAVTATVFGVQTGSAFAQGEAPDPVATLVNTTNLLWIVLGACLVIFMQAGFALVETGFCRAKHAAHVVSTNFAIFGLGFVGFMAIGYPLAFGGYGMEAYLGPDATAPGGALIGSGNWTFFFEGGWFASGLSASMLGFFLYMVAFMDTVATIPTGSMAERWKWKSFCVWGLFCGSLYYPVIAAWTWGGGWLAKTWDTMGLGAGYVDFAGSGVVHAVGGVAALTGAIVLGPRIGKFKNGKAVTIAGHDIPMAMLGTFILLFGWFGFNAASTFSSSDVQFAKVAANTAIAGAFGACTSMLWATKKMGAPDPGMMVNGMLAGLVAITAPCAFVDPWAAALIGVLAGLLIPASIGFIERRGIDDPVGAISVHGVGGMFGVLCVGIFSNGDYGAGWNGSSVEGVTGILYGDAGQLGAQVLGAIVILLVCGTMSFTFFKLQDRFTTGGIRSDELDEIIGLDVPEMGVLAYPEFAMSNSEVTDDRTLVGASD